AFLSDAHGDPRTWGPAARVPADGSERPSSEVHAVGVPGSGSPCMQVAGRRTADHTRWPVWGAGGHCTGRAGADLALDPTRHADRFRFRRAVIRRLLPPEEIEAGA